MLRRYAKYLLAVGAIALSAGASSGKELATATGVDPAAFLRISRVMQPVIEGNRLAQGQVVETKASGQVQILFDDKTRIVVGPNSQLKIDEILMQNNNTASRFAVTAVRGSFRFITGKSAKSAYEIRTPTATLGVRGTIFDFFQNANGLTIAGLWGRGFACTGGTCQNFGGRCDVLFVSAGGQFSRPANNAEAADKLKNLPYVQSQGSLYSPYRTHVGACGQYTGVRSPISIDDEDSPTEFTAPEPKPDQKDDDYHGHHGGGYSSPGDIITGDSF